MGVAYLTAHWDWVVLEPESSPGENTHKTWSTPTNIPRQRWEKCDQDLGELA